MNEIFLCATVCSTMLTGVSLVKAADLGVEGQRPEFRPDALLRLGEARSEVYRWRTLTCLRSPVAVNRMRRALLDAAAKHTDRDQR